MVRTKILAVAAGFLAATGKHMLAHGRCTLYVSPIFVTRDSFLLHAGPALAFVPTALPTLKSAANTRLCTSRLHTMMQVRVGDGLGFLSLCSCLHLPLAIDF